MNTFTSKDSLISYDMRNNAPWSDKIFWSISSNDIDKFKQVMLKDLSMRYINEIFKYRRISFIEHMNEISFMWEEIHFLYAIKHRSLEILKLIDKSWVELSSKALKVLSYNFDEDIFNYLHQKHTFIFGNQRDVDVLIENISHELKPDSLTLILSKGLCATAGVIAALREKENEEGRMAILRILHDHNSEYDWGCGNGSCIHCNNKRKEALDDAWVLETYDYDYTIQWLPVEMMEDLFSLF